LENPLLSKSPELLPGLVAGIGPADALLSLDDGLTQWEGDLMVHYDWFNNWADTTDMFHRMTLTFDVDGWLMPGESIVFLQDTDEIFGESPEPTTMVLFWHWASWNCRDEQEKKVKILDRPADFICPAYV